LSDSPAILGNSPLFDELLPIVRPALPSWHGLGGDVAELVSTGRLTKGRHLRAFEDALADHLGVGQVVAVSSCTIGLMLTFRALGLSGEVLVPSFTFMATVSSLVWAGAMPRFVDVKLDTTNVDPGALRAAVTDETQAIVAVHNFGAPAEIEALEALAAERSIPLVFDAAHGLGSLRGGVPLGRQGTAQVYSLSPTKLVIAGEGGVVATDDAALAEEIRKGREYGNDGAYDSAFAGLNGRLAEFNAVLGRASLSQLDRAVNRRNEVAALYRERLGERTGIAFQSIAAEDRSSFKDLSLTVDPDLAGLDRDGLMRALRAENIDSRAYYRPPCHLQTAYRSLPRASELSMTERLAATSISLPIWSVMDDDIVHNVCSAVERTLDHADQVRAVLASMSTGSGDPR